MTLVVPVQRRQDALTAVSSATQACYGTMENVSFFSDLSATCVAFVEAPQMRRYAKLVASPQWVHVADSEAVETALQRLDSLDPKVQRWHRGALAQGATRKLMGPAGTPCTEDGELQNYCLAGDVSSVTDEPSEENAIPSLWPFKPRRGKTCTRSSLWPATSGHVYGQDVHQSF
eukprot:s1195_g7.t3